MKLALTVVLVATLASTQAIAQSKDSKTLADAKAYTDQQVAAEASLRTAGDASTLTSAKTYADQQVAAEASARSTADSTTLSLARAYADKQVGKEALDRTFVDDGLQGQIDGLQAQVDALKPSAAGTVVITHTPDQFGGWTNPEVSLNPVFPDFVNEGTRIRVTAPTSLVMGLTGPASINGVAYRLNSVEWCIIATAGSANATAAVNVESSELRFAQFAVKDTTARSAAGCYSLSVPSLAVRSLGLVLQLRTDSSGAMTLGSVRSTWVAAAP